MTKYRSPISTMGLILLFSILILIVRCFIDFTPWPLAFVPLSAWFITIFVRAAIEKQST